MHIGEINIIFQHFQQSQQHVSASLIASFIYSVRQSVEANTAHIGGVAIVLSRSLIQPFYVRILFLHRSRNSLAHRYRLPKNDLLSILWCKPVLYLLPIFQLF